VNKAETTLHLCEMQRLMYAKGIEDLEELHECFLEQGPEGIDALWTCECFCRYAAHEVKDLYPEFMVPLVGHLRLLRSVRGYFWPGLMTPQTLGTYHSIEKTRAGVSLRVSRPTTERREGRYGAAGRTFVGHCGCPDAFWRADVCSGCFFGR
jgi:hypothetical protein